MKKRLSMIPIICCLAIIASASLLPAETIDHARARPSPDGKVRWYDCRDIGVEGKGWTDTQSFYDRLPARAAGAAPRAVWELSHHSAGICVRFTTDAPSIQVRWTLRSGDLAMPHMPATGVSGVDLYAKAKDGRWRFVGNGRPVAVTNVASFSPPVGQQCLLYLPLYNGVTSIEIGIPAGRRISPVPQRAKPIVFYGTSITQGGCASRPGMAWTAIVGRELEIPVINLGFSGSGRMEPIMGDLLATLDPSIYVLDCLANMSPADVSERIKPFVKRLRQAHPKTPIVLAEDTSVSNIHPTEKGRIVRAVYQRLTAAGVKNLHFLSNQDMLGDDGEGTVDGVHPTDLGMKREADVFAKALRPILADVK
jgi:hypothetical protein